MAVKTKNVCVDCNSEMTYLDPLDRIVSIEDECICRPCFNKRRIRSCMKDGDLPSPKLHIGSLGRNKSAEQTTEALGREQSALVLELFSEGL